MACRGVSAVVVVVFFVVYTASGLVAGGKLFEMAFSGLFTFGGLSEYQTGIWLTLIIVLIYTSIGGFLAVSLTDFVQGCIMMLALVIMPVVILYGQSGGGVAQAVGTLRSEEHTSELQSLMRISYAVFCLKKKKPHHT